MPTKKNKNRTAFQETPTILGTGADFAHRKIYVFGEIETEMSYRFMVALQTMDRVQGNITVVMSSTGGDVTAGYTIYDSIQLAKNQVTIDCYGACMSIAALVVQAADVRRMSPECRFMVHQGSVHLAEGVDSDTLIAIGKEVARDNQRYHSILSARSGLHIDKVRQLCEKETYFSAAETIKAGFADAIIPVFTKHKRKQ